MIRLSKTAKQTLPLSIVICFFICCLIVNPQRYIESVFNGLLLFAKNVAPALFPFFFFTKLLTGLGTANSLGRLLQKPISKIFNAPSESGYILAMSLISGYPIGAKLVSDLYESGNLTISQCKKISSFTSTSGPLFVVGTVGTLMLASPKAGYVLFVCHALGAIANGLIYRGRTRTQNIKPLQVPNIEENFLNKSITSSVLSVLVVGGYIAIFSMIIDIAIDLNIVDFFANILNIPLSLLGFDQKLASPIIISFIEITRGCHAFAQCGIDLPTILPFIAGLLSFGGLSITFQSLTFLKNCKIPTIYYFLTKTTQAILSFVIAYIVTAIVF